MKTLIIIITQLLLIANLSAQKITIEETRKKFGNGTHAALKVTIYGVSEKDVVKEWKKTMKSFNPESLNSGKESMADNVSIRSISDNPCDIYAVVEEVKEDEEIVLYVGIDLGGVWMNSSDHTGSFSATERILKDFAFKLSKEGLEKKVEDQQKIYDRLVKDKEQLVKDKDYKEKKIEDYKEKIEDLKTEIEENIKEQEAKTAEIAEQEKILEIAKNKASKLN